MKEFLADLVMGLFLVYILAATWVFGVLMLASVITGPMPGWKAVILSVLGFVLVVAGFIVTLALGWMFREMTNEPKP